MKFTIGVTTHNRLDIVKKMARSFYESERPYPYAIRIYDDASTEYDEETLREIFPDAVTIVRHPEQLGADANMGYMYRDFLQYDGDFLVNADSDILFCKRWMQRAMELLPETDGVLSMLRSAVHPAIREGGCFCENEVIGAAGTILSRAVVQKIMKSDLDTSRSLDWQWCAALRGMGIRILTTRESLVQHIGLTGQNSTLADTAYGEGFCVDTLANGQAINDVLSDAINHGVRRKANYYLFPFGNVLKGSRIVLYGAGRVGSEYLKQIQHTGYAEVVAVIDEKGDGVQALPVESLGTITFDAIVLATALPHIARSMRERLRELYGNRYETKIIEPCDFRPIPVSTVTPK